MLLIKVFLNPFKILQHLFESVKFTEDPPQLFQQPKKLPIAWYTEEKAFPVIPLILIIFALTLTTSQISGSLWPYIMVYEPINL